MLTTAPSSDLPLEALHPPQPAAALGAGLGRRQSTLEVVQGQGTVLTDAFVATGTDVSRPVGLIHRVGDLGRIEDRRRASHDRRRVAGRPLSTPTDRGRSMEREVREVAFARHA